MWGQVSGSSEQLIRPNMKCEIASSQKAFIQKQSVGLLAMTDKFNAATQ